MVRLGGLAWLIAMVWAGSAHAQVAAVGRAGLTSIDYVLLDRELTLDADVVELGGRLQMVQIDAGLFSTNVTAFAFTIGYGVGDVLEIWAEPVIFVDPEAELGFNFGASVRAVNSEVFDMAPSIAVPMMLTGDGDTVPAIILGLDSRIALGSVVSLFVLHGLVTPVFSSDTVLISANLGLGIQPAKIVGLRFETRPFAVETADGDTLSYGDVVPFSFELLVAVKSVDLFLGMQFPDLENAGDFFVFTFGAMGRI